MTGRNADEYLGCVHLVGIEWLENGMKNDKEVLWRNNKYSKLHVHPTGYMWGQSDGGIAFYDI